MNPWKIRSLAAKLGCEIREDFEVIQLDAPPGKLLAATGTHYKDYYYNPGFKRDAWNDLLLDLKEGLIDCTIPFCEICHPCPECNGLAYMSDGSRCSWCNGLEWIMVNRFFYEKWGWPSRDFGRDLELVI